MPWRTERRRKLWRESQATIEAQSWGKAFGPPAEPSSPMCFFVGSKPRALECYNRLLAWRDPRQAGGEIRTGA